MSSLGGSAAETILKNLPTELEIGVADAGKMERQVRGKCRIINEL